MRAYKARNLKTEGDLCVLAAETMAKLPGINTAADHQRILGPLSELVFPFFDIMFPREVLDHVVKMVSHSCSDTTHN